MPPQIEDIAGRGPSTIETFVLTPPSGRRDLGAAAILTDFSDLPESLRYLGARIAGVVKQEYFGDAAGNVPQRITRTLRAANDALAQEAAAGTAQWVGILRAVVVFVADGYVFVSSTGGCAALFCRRGTVAEIPLEGGGGSRPFGAMTNAPLEAEDEVFIAPRTILGVRDVETLLSENPKRLYDWIRRSDGIACLRVSTDALPRRSAFSRISLPVLRLSPSFRSLLRFSPRNLFGRRKSAPLTIRERIRGTVLRPSRVIPGIFFWLRGGARVPASIIRTAMRAGKVFVAPKRTATIAASAVIISVLLIGASFLEKPESTNPNAAALESARAALERGETQTILGDADAAVKEYEAGIAALGTAEDPNEQGLLADLVARRNDLLGIRGAAIERAVAFAGFPLPLDAQRITAVADPDAPDAMMLAIGGPEFSAVWLNDRPEPTGGTFLFLPPPLRGGIADIAHISGTALIALLTDDGIALVEPNGRTVSSVAPRSETQPLTLLAGGKGHLLAVSPASETIKRIGIAADGTMTEGPWLRRDDSALSQARDATVIGDDFLVLLDDNTFVRYRNGKRIALYRIEGRGWGGAAQAFAALPDERLLVLDSKNGRLLIVTAAGDIEQQIESDALRAGRDIAIAPDGSSTFVLTDEAVLRVALEGS